MGKSQSDNNKDKNGRSSRLVNPLYELDIANIQPYTEGSSLYPNAVSFDIYIYHTNPEESGLFYFASGQYYIKFNPNVANGGLLSYDIVPNSTEFSNPDAVPRNPSITFDQLNLERNLPILFINAPIVSSVYPGTRVVRMKLSSNVPALNYRDLQLAWVDSTIATPFTMVGAFVDSIETDITGDGTFLVDTSYIVFPVELSGFSGIANRNDVALNWTTVSEVNNSGFDIERTSNNLKWQKIGYIKGNGTKNSVTNYNFEDLSLNSGKYKYRLKQIDYNGNYEYFDLDNEISVGVPEEFSLKQNYPNPFNPVTKIDFDLPVNSNTSLKIYSMDGKEIKSLINGSLNAGYYSVDFDASQLPSGVYYYRLESGNLVSAKKLMLLK
ncbi:MAG TPA: T9SS type A sorting domain-containing protein [Ignavibacteria bacterium]|nr:T9SS type A sorting domain-containing protein [Ignavibacteria bacterium]HMR40789.1 T9SS type A sorting domain-containing protein [Ignavibacteria bacterium]